MNIPYLSSAVAMWRPSAVRKNWPGVAVAIVIALSATFISSNYGGPQLLYALFFGLAFHFLSTDKTCQPGIEFSSKVLLRAGVALLGVRITVEQIASVGLTPLVIVIGALLATIGFGCVLARWLKRPVEEKFCLAAQWQFAAHLPHWQFRQCYHKPKKQKNSPC